MRAISKRKLCNNVTGRLENNFFFNNQGEKIVLFK